MLGVEHRTYLDTHYGSIRRKASFFVIVDDANCSTTLSSFTAKDFKFFRNSAVEHRCGSPLPTRNKHFQHHLPEIFSSVFVVSRGCFSVNF